MPVVIGIQLRRTKDMHDFIAGEADLKIGDYCIVETENGLEWGVVTTPERMVEKTKEKLYRVVRKASSNDYNRMKENRIKNRESHQKVLKKTQERELDMKLACVNYTFDRNKLFIYYTAEGRIDFRELVKDLGFILKTRIQMVQIGVRDEAKMLGGYGPCGRELCCCSFLKDFKPVSIDMAKEQDLSLNPHKISGVCGRLMCCISYEHEFYHESRKDLPETESKVNTPDGPATVKSANIITKEVTVEFAAGVTKKYPVSDLSWGIFKFKFKK